MVIQNEKRAKISVEIDGKVHENWQNYHIESSFLTPADAFDFSIGLPNGITPPDVKEGGKCSIKIENETIMTGFIDTILHSIDKHHHSYQINGRDTTSLLVDCSAPIHNFKGLSLLDAVKKIAEPMGIKKVLLRGEATEFDKTDIDIGISGWDAIIHLANSAGLHAWSDPDGTLIIGNADYTTEPVAKLILNYNGRLNNIIRLSHEKSSHNRYSEVTFLGQSHGKSSDSAKHNLKYVHKDDSVTFEKKKTIVVGDAENLESLKKAAEKYLADQIIEGETINITIQGHFVDQAKQTLFKPGQRVYIESDIFGIDAIYFLMGCRYSLTKYEGTVTELTFKPDGVWLPESKGSRKKQAKKQKQKENKETIVLDSRGYDEIR